MLRPDQIERSDKISAINDSNPKYDAVMCILQEMAELTIEVTNAERGREYSNMPAEIADVYLILEQTKRRYGYSDEVINEYIDKKLSVLESRIEAEKF